MTRLITLRQCTGKENLEWRLALTESMARRALVTPREEVPVRHQENDVVKETSPDHQTTQGVVEKSKNSVAKKNTLPNEDEDILFDEETDATGPKSDFEMNCVNNRDLFFRYATFLQSSISTLILDD